MMQAIITEVLNAYMIRTKTAWLNKACMLSTIYRYKLHLIV